MTSADGWDTTRCPECGQIAEIVWRSVLDSTDGPVEHAKVRCLDRHSFLMPAADLYMDTSPVRSADVSHDKA